MDGMAMDGEGLRWMAMDSIKGRGDGESTAMGDEERCKLDGNVGSAGGGSDKRQCGIKT